MTNYERIKSMDINEVVDSIMSIGYGCECCVYDDYLCTDDCEFGIKKWLESEEDK